MSDNKVVSREDLKYGLFTVIIIIIAIIIGGFFDGPIAGLVGGIFLTIFSSFYIACFYPSSWRSIYNWLTAKNISYIS